MLHRVFLVPGRGDLEPGAARRHWEQRHGDVFGPTPGLLHYRQNRPVDEQWAAGTALFCSETWYADRATERAAYASDHYRDTVTPDEASFLDRDGVWSAVVLDDDRPAAGDGLQLLWFDQTPPPGLPAREVLVDRPVPAPGTGTSLWVADVADADAALALIEAAAAVALLVRPVQLDPPQAESSRAFVDVATVAEAAIRAARRWPDAEALVYPERRATYGELLQGAQRVARGMVAHGLLPGERIGILMPNSIEFVEVFLAAHLAGLVPVTVNARYKAHELHHVITDAELVALFTTDAIADHVCFVDVVADAFAAGRPPSLRTLVMVGASRPEGYLSWAEWEASAEQTDPAALERRTAELGPDDIAVVMYTSGTTSSPRGCPLSHRALMGTAAQVVQRLGLTCDERFWDPLPLFHMGGLLPMLATMLVGGRTISLVHFDADTAMRQLVGERATFCYSAFPTITQSLIHHPDFATADLSSIRGVLETAPAETLRQVQAAFGEAKVVASYGLTEAGGVITYSHLDDPEELRFTTSGRPFPGVRVRIVDPVTDKECAPGATGEIRLAGPGMFAGYLNDPEYTRSRTDPDGFLCTGDLGTLDGEGRIAYSGRIKDMLKVGGENVAAAEIEAHLGRHPAVKVACVVGVPDARLGEVPVAFVELVPGHAVAASALVDHCRGQVAGFKVPRRVWFVHEWPMSSTKIQKFRLRERAEVLLAEESTT